MTEAWNGSDNSGYTLSTTINTNDTASVSSSGGYVGVRSVSGKTTGSYYFEFTGVAVEQYEVHGFGNSTYDYTTAIAGWQDANSVGFIAHDNTVYWGNNAHFIGFTTSPTSPFTSAWAVDFTNKQIWVRFSNNAGSTWSPWNEGIDGVNNPGADPSTATGGATWTSTVGGPWMLTAGGFGVAVSQSSQMRTPAATFLGSVPTGFTAWDAGAPAGASFIPPGPLTIAVGGAELLRRNPILHRRDLILPGRK